jgi:muramoyltetrapeptide carboxypeptidase
MTGTFTSVGLLGLSGYESDQRVIDRAHQYFRDHGKTVRMLPEPRAASLRFAASIEERLLALSTFVEDESIGLVLGLRGGYGLTQLLPEIDFEGVARAIDGRGLQFCGFSDFTAFGLALYSRTGRGSLTGPSAVSFGREEVDPFTEDVFWHAVARDYVPIRFPTDSAASEAEGILWGGNLSMLVSLLGTPYFPDINNGILFVEEVNEHPYRVERMLLQLLYAGVLDRQRAVIIGQVTNYRLSEYDAGYDLPMVVAELRRRLSIPVVTGLPFGHVAHQATLPIGVFATLDVKDQEAILVAGIKSASLPAVAA